MRVWLPAVRVSTGTDVFVKRLAAGLRRAGHDPIVQWFPSSYELTPWLLKRVVPPLDTDIVHTGSWQGFACKRPGIPLIVTEHNFVDDPAFAPYRTAAQALYHRLFVCPNLRRSYEAADTIVAVSNYTAKAMRDALGMTVRVVHNWVNTEQFCPSETQVIHKDSVGPFRLLYVGNPSRWKGVDVLPVLAKELGNRFELRCLGGLRETVRLKNCPDNLVFLPKVSVDEMPRLYYDVHAVLVPARHESFGYVALEGMSCGVPVVGFRNTGTAEVCVDGETALLTETDDIRALANSCVLLSENRDLLRRMGENARKRAVEQFSEQVGISKYIAIYSAFL